MPVRSCLLYLMLTRLQGSRRRLSAQVAANFVLLGHAMGWKASMCFHRLAGSVRHAFQFCLYRLRHLCYRLRFQLCLCRWQLMYRTRSALADHGMLTVEQFHFEFQLRSCRSCVILSYMSRFVMSTFQWAAETWEMLRPKHCILDMSKVVQQFQLQQIPPEFQHATFLWLIEGLCHMLVWAMCDVHHLIGLKFVTSTSSQFTYRSSVFFLGLWGLRTTLAHAIWQHRHIFWRINMRTWFVM